MTDGHLDAIRLAEHAEGLLDAPDANGVEAHLRDCPTCQGAASALAAVNEQLTAAPASLPTPPEVATRVEHALAAEQHHLDGLRRHRKSPREPGLLMRMRMRMPVLVGAAATTAVIGIAGYVVVTSNLGGDDATDQTASTAESADEGSTGDSGDSGTELSPEAEEEAGGTAADDSFSADSDQGEAAPQLEPAEPGARGDSAQIDRTALQAEILAITEGRQDGPEPASAAGCGAELAAERGLEPVGTASTDLGENDAVLVVLDTTEDGAVEGWVLPSCDVGSNDALGMLTVPAQ